SHHLFCAAPGLECRPDASLQPESIDRSRRFDRVDPVEPDAGPLESALLQHAARSRVGHARARLQRLMGEVGEGKVDHGMQRFGGVALIPERHAEPVAQLRRIIVMEHDPARTDDGLVAQRDQERCLAIFVRAADEFLGVRYLVGIRNARGVLRDAAIVGERRNRFSVLEACCAQGKPLGLEDGDTRFMKAFAWYFFQQGHGTGSRLKCEEGEPVTRLPLSEPYEAPPVRLDDRRTSILSTVLLGRCLRHRYYGYLGAAFSFRCELNLSIDEREQRVIFAGTDIAAGVPFGAALTRKNIAGEHALAAGRLQAEPPARGVAAVS